MNFNAVDRRELLRRCGMGFGSLGLAALMNETGLLTSEIKANDQLNPLTVKKPQFPAKAKRVIHLFMNGGPSHVDTFDPKPLLTKYHGKALPMANLRTERKTGAAFGSPFKFKKYGKSGIEVSEIFEHTAQHIDDICVIRSMHADVPNHEPSLMLMNCGEARQVRPSFGSWMTYGLGSENQNLPGFIAMCPGGYPIQESQNWQAGFLPGVYQGTYIDSQHTDVEKLVQYVRNKYVGNQTQRKQLDLLLEFNREHQKNRPNDPQLEARIQSFELAFRMQKDATDAFDISREPEKNREAYGNSPVARTILMAKRLIERGVRMVQVWQGRDQPWDSHDDLEIQHKRLATDVDKAIAALITDLKRLGLFEETLIIWGGEFGRTPVVELPTPGSNAGKINGRDHNHHGFTMWLAGGGVKGGYVHGATDEFGFAAAEKKVHVHDLHATLLKLLGFDHEKFTYRYAGRDFRFTDLYGNVVNELIA
ncbi:DUF1501 domain-containing protein [Telmatocola sphagniphila]|uniref:DUF1501 domain-containing protein n=1 Tax=Telmatocola sphagniphila TaxID=1123043 RepID=A0A8E6B7I0_9BACT|nr:DUF1501 domain-containing protein [Telmatocola sphagniphila]QVL33166.1 DUF1501 domain-containing protein [Telmatocola sphagniphila]